MTCNSLTLFNFVYESLIILGLSLETWFLVYLEHLGFIVIDQFKSYFTITLKQHWENIYNTSKFFYCSLTSYFKNLEFALDNELNYQRKAKGISLSEMLYKLLI